MIRLRRITLARIGTALVVAWLGGMTVLLMAITGCEQGYSVSGSGGSAVPLEPNVTTALERMHARDPHWTAGIRNVVMLDQDPPPGVNAAVVDCPGTVGLFRTTFGQSVEFFERLLVHEAFEIQHGCRDNDRASGIVSRCYMEGRTRPECLARLDEMGVRY